MKYFIQRHASRIVLFWLLGVATGYAQEAGDVGLDITLWASKSVGAIVHITDHIALRPAFSLTRSEWKEEGGYEEQNIRTNLSGELRLQIYPFPTERFHPYIGVGASYLLISSDDSSVSGQSSRSREQTEDGIGLTGYLGLYYPVGRWFGLFGEFGVGYQRFAREWEEETTSPASERIRSTVTELFDLGRLGLGVVFYL